MQAAELTYKQVVIRRTTRSSVVFEMKRFRKDCLSSLLRLSPISPTYRIALSFCFVSFHSLCYFSPFLWPPMSLQIINKPIMVPRQLVQHKTAHHLTACAISITDASTGFPVASALIPCCLSYVSCISCIIRSSVVFYLKPLSGLVRSPCSLTVVLQLFSHL